MNQRDRILKAIVSVRPVALSVGDRRPAGMSTVEADAVAISLRAAVEQLEQALHYYDAASDRRQR